MSCTFTSCTVRLRFKLKLLNDNIHFFSFACRPKLSHIEHVIQELMSTEKVYVNDLSEVVDVGPNKYSCMCVDFSAFRGTNCR